MIIRFTVEDNDFGDLIYGFVAKLYLYTTGFPKGITALKEERQIEIINDIDKVSKLLNPNITKSYTEEDKDILIKRIKESFVEYVYNRRDDSTAEYLISKFKVEIMNSMEDKWENGEAFYWFQHSNHVINQ